LGQDSIEAAENAVALEPTNRVFLLSRQVSRWELLRFRSDQDGAHSAPRFEELGQVYEDIKASLVETPKNLHGIEKRKYLVRIGQYLLPVLNADRREAVRAELQVTISDLREGYRATQQPLSEAHCMLARNLVLDARHQWESGQQETALKSLIDAETFFERAINPIPNNRPWRTELIHVELLISEWLAEQNKAEQARDKTDEAIRNTIHLLESDPKDHDSRKLVIRCLIRFGDLSVALEDSPGAYRGYFTAAHDCHFLFTAGEVWRSWALPVRAWAAAQAYVHADESTRKTMVPPELKMYEGWKTRFGFDPKWMSDVLHGKIKVPRPDSV
jgi:tetratricopeptide (TPR) repeat protein